MKEIEYLLMHASSESEAYELLKKYNLGELKKLQGYLKAYTKSTSKQAIKKSIVDCTYVSFMRSKIIRQIEL